MSRHDGRAFGCALCKAGPFTIQEVCAHAASQHSTDKRYES